MDGNTRSTLKDINPETTEISSVRLLRYNNSPLYVYSCQGRINFYTNDTSCLVSQYLGNKIGEVEGLQLFDFNNSGSSNILLGTPTSVLRILGDFIIPCTAFNINIAKTEVSCSKTDGKLELSVTGGTAPYNYQWNDNSTSNSLINLSPGNYWVKVQDNGTCYKKRTMTLSQAYISGNVQVTDEGCVDKGAINVTLTHVNAPYTIKWSNSNVNLYNSGLLQGSYSVTITDSKNCKFEKTIAVNKDSVAVKAIITNVSCSGLSDGNIKVNIVSGNSPFVYNWGSTNYSNHADSLKAGKYSVTITDNLGCEKKLAINITEPSKITYTQLVTPDDLKTINWDGKVMINNISGGTPPYQVYWPRLAKFGDYVDILPSGKYAFIVSDANNCEIKDTAIINSFTTGINDSKAESFQVFPNPAINELFINDENNLASELKIELIDQNGQVVRNYQLSGDKVKRIGLDGLTPGMYILKFRTNKSLYTRKVIIK